VFTRTFIGILSWATWIHPTSSACNFLWSILILPSLYLGLSGACFPYIVSFWFVLQGIKKTCLWCIRNFISYGSAWFMKTHFCEVLCACGLCLNMNMYDMRLVTFMDSWLMTTHTWNALEIDLVGHSAQAHYGGC
jgi:hypothetical protein